MKELIREGMRYVETVQSRGVLSLDAGVSRLVDFMETKVIEELPENA
jgi:hypothetical protein